MKRSALRALTIAICAMGLVAWVGQAYTGYDLGTLEYIVTHEYIPEISQAAGLALVDNYADTKTVGDLEVLAATGQTIGLRTAASGALSILYRTKTEDELMAILTGDADPMVRAAAVEPALLYLIAKDADELKGLAESGATYEMQLAAAKAYYIITASDLTYAGLETAAAGDGALAVAAGEVLAGFYLFVPPVKTQAVLEGFALNGATEGLRLAGGKAFASYLIDSDLTAQDIEVILVEIAGTGSAEYRAAYMLALANRYGA